MDRIIAPSTYRKRVAAVAALAEEYAAARRSALAAKAAWRAAPTGRNLLAREDATGAALTARHWLKGAREYLARVNVQPGGRLSPRELERRAAKAASR